MKYLFYQGRITPGGVRNIQVLINEAYKAGHKEITLCLASEGGDVNSGVGLCNFIRMTPIQVHTHAAGQCDSIAASIFAVGEKRTASELSAFTTHQATYTDGPNKGIRAPNTDLISQPFERIGWTAEDIKSRFAQDDFRMTPTLAKSLKLVTEIVDLKLGADDEIVPVHIPD